jgi:hypothetical protein
MSIYESIFSKSGGKSLLMHFWLFYFLASYAPLTLCNAHDFLPRQLKILNPSHHSEKLTLTSMQQSNETEVESISYYTT